MNYCLFLGTISSIGDIVFFKEKATCEFVVSVLRYVSAKDGKLFYDEIPVKAWNDMSDNLRSNYSIGDTVRVECKLGVFSGIGKESGKPYKIISLDLKNIMKINGSDTPF